MEGYALRLSGNVSFEDEDIMVDRRVRLRPFPPERISFMRDEYPELFRQSRSSARIHRNASAPDNRLTNHHPRVDNYPVPSILSHKHLKNDGL